MFGASAYGVLGTSGFCLDAGAFDSSRVVFVVFQAMFCGTATTIVSGAVAERMQFRGYLIVALLLAGLIYPVFGHWSSHEESSSLSGWLYALGFRDFAGSTVVHSVGGWVALASVLTIGPREGRFPPDESQRDIPGHSLPMAVLGTLLLWVGWFGFNGGSTLAFDESVPRVVTNTLLGGASGLLTGSFRAGVSMVIR